MGYPKALLPLGSDTFLSHIIYTARTAGLGNPTIVLGRSASAIQSTVKLQQVEVLINPNPNRGQLSSIQMALTSLEPDCNAVMIWPVDQPLVSVELIEALACLFLDTGSLIASPVVGEKRGHPVIFRKDLFPEFMATPLDEGSKPIMTRHREHTVSLPTEEVGTVFDIDTPSDYETACGRKLEAVLKSGRCL